MFRKLSLKMTFLYGIIIMITIVYIDFFLIMKYEDSQFYKNELEYLTYANIFGKIIKDDISNVSSLISKTEQYGEGIDGRILVLDNGGMVIFDKYRSFVGVNLLNKEIKKSFESKNEARGYYKTDDEYIMMITTPVLQVNEVVGMVLISTSVTHIKEDVENLRNQVIGISSIAVVIAIILSIITGSQISKPVRKLTSASQSIQKGILNTKVDISRKDEIGKLALTFNKMSEELYKLDKNRRMFISDVSHELKTPLASIKALIESLINGNNDIDTYNEYLKDVNNEIDRLANLVKSLLTVARLEEVKINKEPIELHNEIQSILKIVNPLLKEKNINLINNCEKDIDIFGDKGKVREVLINLIDNAIKYNKCNGNIEVSCTQRMWKKSIRVKDNGIGMSEKELPFIFDNFYRIDKSRQSDSGGSGIGLFIVKRIVELHGWSIRVNSKLGEGTEFIIDVK